MTEEGIEAFDRSDGRPSDVCLIVEGCYPHVAGGVSTWVDWLIRAQPDLTFRVVSIVADGERREARFPFPDNLIGFQEVILGGGFPRKGLARGMLPSWMIRSRLDRNRCDTLAASLARFILTGELKDLEDVHAIVRDDHITLNDLLHSRHTFEIVAATYRRLMPYGTFEDFYWAWHSLVGGLLSVLKAPLPSSRIFHAISTGYAGLLLARAKIEFGARAIVTEHGIYTNERRIELLMADWLVDTIDNGYRLDRPRLDLRDLWIRAFESYARACYEASDRITTLFSENQPMQRELGADPDRLQVIANGIDFERFAAIAPVPPEEPPTVALIGRVVPIKDVKTFIRAIERLRRRIPAIRAHVAGPMDEDEAYARDCQALCRDLKLEDALTFTGRIAVTELLRKVHVVALTSLSEAQPLTVLEAGAAARPCVTTNVGACREMLEGAEDEDPALGPGGIVADILNTEQIADALEALLRCPETRMAYGLAMQQRVQRYYTTPLSRGRYRALYDLSHTTAEP